MPSSHLRLCAGLLITFRICHAAGTAAITDLTSYNIGSQVKLRLQPGGEASASIRYAGESNALVSNLRVRGDGYQDLWRVPEDARTGRYLIDLSLANGTAVQAAGSFAVHRQMAKIVSVELDKTFYTSGDSVNPRIVVENVSSHALQNLQVEFEPFTYPWIAPDPGEKPSWKRIVASPLSLAPGEKKEFRVTDATSIQIEKQPEAAYYCVVIRDARQQDRIYDLAFALPGFAVPVNKFLPKQYPFLYLYWHLNEVVRGQAYREFYPPSFVSEAIRFDSSHTMFATGQPLRLSYSIEPGKEEYWREARVRERIVDEKGAAVRNVLANGSAGGAHASTAAEMKPGLYTLIVSVEASGGITIAENRLEFAVNRLPKSILIFCAHQDDDTAHPGLIQAATQNQIPIHFVYWTGGDAGGCDRFYMHSCDAARAMDFGEVRMEEARASLRHLGVRKEDISFLGLPDGGLEQIWYDHKSSSDPYLSVLLASDHAPYREAALPNLPYSREAAIGAAKEYIQRYQPAMIVTGHPDERHVDHRTNNWIVVKAMEELLREGKLASETELITDVVYGPMAGRHAPYRFEKETFYVSGEAAKMGQEALWYYQSQDGNHQQANIVDFNKLPRREAWPHFRILDWAKHEGWNESRPQ